MTDNDFQELQGQLDALLGVVELIARTLDDHLPSDMDKLDLRSLLRDYLKQLPANSGNTRDLSHRSTIVTLRQLLGH